MVEALTDPAGIAYTAAFFGSGIICLLLIPRARAFEDPEIRSGLVWLLLTTGAWGLLKTAFLLVPPPLREPAYTLGLVVGFATVWIWLYFCSAYTARTFHRSQTLRRLSVAIFLFVASVKVTNPIHGLYFTASEATSPFAHLAIEHGLVHWSATGLSYVLAAVGLFMIFELYVNSEYDTRPLAILAILLGIPVVFDLIAISTPLFINFIYAPIGVAIFAVGVLSAFQERLLAVSTALPGGAASVYLDGDRRIRDTSTAAVDLFPALEGATGDQFEEVLPEVGGLVDDENIILELGDRDNQQYYFVETTPVGLAGSGAQVVTFTDVTRVERKRRQLRHRERELNEQNELYRAILAASFAFVYRTDLDGNLTFVSASVEDSLGYTPEDLVGEPVYVLAPTDESAEQAQTYAEDVLAGEALQIRDFSLEHRDGRQVYVDIQVVPIYDPDVSEEERTVDDIVGQQGLVRETTERHRREGLISVINRVLRHNVRNKLAVINGYGRMLADDLDGQAAANADQIVDAADQLLDLTESARKIEQTKNRPADLETHDVVPILEAAISRVETQYPTAAITITAPESAIALTLPRIETAFFELLENAAKHSGDAPSIAVTVDIEMERLSITIADDGPGLPESEREVLATGVEDPLVHGSGLGLWLAYWIVTTLDGEIEVLDTDQGTTTRLNLPTSDE